MIECANCGASVTQQYVRVFCPEGVEQPLCCPKYPDKIRDPDGEVREKRT
jgi:hypothetical protein